MMRGILGLCAALVVSSPAVSAVALSDDFEAEAYNLNLTSLTNFTATAGNVDVVGPGSYSIACSSGPSASISTAAAPRAGPR